MCTGAPDGSTHRSLKKALQQNGAPTASMKTGPETSSEWSNRRHVFLPCARHGAPNSHSEQLAFHICEFLDFVWPAGVRGKRASMPMWGAWESAGEEIAACTVQRTAAGNSYFRIQPQSWTWKKLRHLRLVSALGHLALMNLAHSTEPCDWTGTAFPFFNNRPKRTSLLSAAMAPEESRELLASIPCYRAASPIR